MGTDRGNGWQQFLVLLGEFWTRGFNDKPNTSPDHWLKKPNTTDLHLLSFHPPSSVPCEIPSDHSANYIWRRSSDVTLEPTAGGLHLRKAEKAFVILISAYIYRCIYIHTHTHTQFLVLFSWYSFPTLPVTHTHHKRTETAKCLLTH